MRWLNRDPIQEKGGLNLYRFVMNSPLGVFDPLGLDVFRLLSYENLTDCQNLEAAIAHMTGMIDKAIPSMSDINQMFDNAQYMQDVGLGGEFAYAGMGGGAAAVGLHEFNIVRASRTAYKLGGVTSSIVFDQIGEKTITDIPNAGVNSLTHINILNPADGVAEKENEMGRNMSESTYETIRGLQVQLANMMSMYQQNCPCKK